jgi:hypothetical protein
VARNKAARNKRVRMMKKMAVTMRLLLKKKTGSHPLMKLTRRCSRKLRRNHRIN